MTALMGLVLSSAGGSAGLGRAVCSCRFTFTRKLTFFFGLFTLRMCKESMCQLGRPSFEIPSASVLHSAQCCLCLCVLHEIPTGIAWSRSFCWAFRPRDYFLCGNVGQHRLMEFVFTCRGSSSVASAIQCKPPTQPQQPPIETQSDPPPQLLLQCLQCRRLVWSHKRDSICSSLKW